eukprot:gene25340-46351_t
MSPFEALAEPNRRRILDMLREGERPAGDLVEAIFLLRAYRATLPRLGTTCALDTSRMALDRRISATFKDLP